MRAGQGDCGNPLPPLFDSSLFAPSSLSLYSVSASRLFFPSILSTALKKKTFFHFHSFLSSFSLLFLRVRPHSNLDPSIFHIFHPTPLWPVLWVISLYIFTDGPNLSDQVLFRFSGQTLEITRHL